MKHNWTKEEEQWLTDNYPSLGYRPCAEHVGVRVAQVKSKVKRMGLVRNNRRYLTPEEIDYIRQHYENTPTVEVAATLGLTNSQIYNQVDILGLHKSKEIIAAQGRARYAKGDLHRYQFTKGNTPFCKGLKQSEWMSPEGIERTKATRFRTGHCPANWRPVGSERVNIYGYIEVKVEEGRYGWRQKHREVWQAAHGPVPTGYNVMFKDGNKQNCSLDNLYLASNAEKMKQNTIHNYPSDLKEVIMTKGLITREINKQKRRQDAKV